MGGLFLVFENAEALVPSYGSLCSFELAYYESVCCIIPASFRLFVMWIFFFLQIFMRTDTSRMCFENPP
jgi:hypothetical protein